MTPRAIILKKAEYFVGRKLLEKEQKYILRNIKSGTVKELKIIVAKLKLVNSAETIADIVERHCKQGSFNDLSKDNLTRIMEDLAIRTWASVSHGLRLMNTISRMSTNQLVTFIFNMYLKDIMKQERAGRRRASNIMKEPITTNQSNRPPQVESPYAWYSFENAEKDNDMAMINDYDSKTQKLRTEMDSRPLHSEPKKPIGQKPKSPYIPPITGRPTGGDPEADTRK